MVNLSDCLAWHVLLHVKFWIHANCFILGELYDLYWGNYILDLKIILGLPWYAKIKYVYMTINWRFSAREQVKILMTKEKLLKFSVRNKNKLNIPNLILTISKTTWPRRNLQISSFFIVYIIAPDYMLILRIWYLSQQISVSLQSYKVNHLPVGTIRLVELIPFSRVLWYLCSSLTFVHSKREIFLLL